MSVPFQVCIDWPKTNAVSSAINQQIATKTIRKLGYEVSAAWDGKEALEYLAAAQQGKYPKPDIILMDVQMPVIDGYKCTHLLRRHAPYSTYVQDVPIVAMTASAIQGDREKCRKAGMDDYLAKPVQTKTLERMLLRWSRTKRRGSLSGLATSCPQSSECSGHAEQCSSADIPNVGLEDDQQTTFTSSAGMTDTGDSVREERARTPEVPTQTGQGAYEPSPLDSSMAPNQMQPVRRSDTAEMDQYAQDDKLIDAAGGPDRFLRRGGSFGQSATAADSLTEENMEKHQMEEDEADERCRRQLHDEFHARREMMRDASLSSGDDGHDARTQSIGS